MSFKKIYAIIRREYLERVRTKAFWIGTALIPIMLFAYVFVQVASNRRAAGDRRVAVVDLTGRLYEPLATELAANEIRLRKAPDERGQGIHWILEKRTPAGSLDEEERRLRARLLDREINGYLILDPARIEKNQADYYAVSASEMIAMGQLQTALDRVLLEQRIASRGLPPDLTRELERKLDMRLSRVTVKGASEEGESAIFVPIMFMFIMYMSFFMYGMQNMKGVIDEKTNRIVEVIVASVRPTELMLGKIVGIGLVGLTQYVIWSLVAMNLSLPAIAGLLSAGGTGVPPISVSTLLYFILFFLFGYFLYASIYSAIGAPFNTDQEASQLAMVPGMFIVGVWAVFPALLKNPNGGVATFASLFPLTSPLVMFFRTAIAEPPAWQIALSILLLAGSTVGMAWVAGRIYRVGILMYGKKPTIPEILRWIRYKPGETLQPALPSPRE